MEAPSQLKLSSFSLQPVSWRDYTSAGLDEAGRGCLAGPVVAAAVILNPHMGINGLGDSKVIPAAKREKLAVEIKLRAIAWGIGISWQNRIDEINILQATFEAMTKAITSLKIQPDYVLLDGPHQIPQNVLDRFALNLARQRAIVGGDKKIDAISAASILAKTFRDRLMRSFARKWPEYGFEQHKGYGTPAHLETLRRLGPCPLHRITFKRVLPKCLLPLNTFSQDTALCPHSP